MNEGKVIGSIEGGHVKSDAPELYVMGSFAVGTGRGDPDENGRQIPCIAVSIISANSKPTITLIIPEDNVVELILQLQEAKGRMIRENPRKG